VTALSNYLNEVFAELELSDEEVEARKLVIDKLEGELHEQIPSLKRLFWNIKIFIPHNCVKYAIKFEKKMYSLLLVSIVLLSTNTLL